MIVPVLGGGVVFSVLTNVHRTDSPALRSIELGELPSLHVAEVSVQPSVEDSETEYVPEDRLSNTRCPPSESVNCVSPKAKPKLASAPSGIVCFWTVIVPGFGGGGLFVVLTKVQVTTLSPSISMELGELPSSHVADSSVQPSGTSSLTEYVPGSSAPVSLCSPSWSTKCFCWPLGRARTNSNPVGSPAGSVFLMTMILPPGLFVASMPGTPSINVPSTTAIPASTQRRREAPTFPIKTFSLVARLSDRSKLRFPL